MNKSFENFDNEYEACSIFEIDYKRASPLIEKKKKKICNYSPCVSNIKLEIIGKLENQNCNKNPEKNFAKKSDFENLKKKKSEDKKNQENLIFEEHFVTDDDKTFLNLKKINSENQKNNLENFIVKNKKTKFSFLLKKVNFSKNKKIIKKKKLNNLNQFCSFNCFLKKNVDKKDFSNLQSNFFNRFISRFSNNTISQKRKKASFECICKNNEFLFRVKEILEKSSSNEDLKSSNLYNYSKIPSCL